MELGYLTLKVARLRALKLLAKNVMMCVVARRIITSPSFSYGMMSSAVRELLEHCGVLSLQLMPPGGMFVIFTASWDVILIIFACISDNYMHM